MSRGISKSEFNRKRDYLAQYRMLMSNVQLIRDEISLLFSEKDKTLGGIDSSCFMSSVERSKTVENYNRKLESLIQYLEQLEQNKNKICIHIRISIDAVKEATERLLLNYHYVEGMTWERVAEKMNYTNQHIYEIHRRALADLVII